MSHMDGDTAPPPSLPQLRSHGRAGRVQREERKPDGTQRTVCSFIWNIKTYHGAAAPLRNRPFMPNGSGRRETEVSFFFPFFWEWNVSVLLYGIKYS